MRALAGLLTAFSGTLVLLVLVVMTDERIGDRTIHLLLIAIAGLLTALVFLQVAPE